jgi:uncharacterized protein YcfJ
MQTPTSKSAVFDFKEFFMQLQPRSSRAIALLTGTVLAAGTLLHPTPARADKAKTYKYGAIALGVAAAYLASKGKTVPAAAAAAGGYYAYKKGQNAKNDSTRYGYYPDSNNAVYPDSDGYDMGYRADYRTNAAVKNPGGKFDLSPYLR